jgi:hypothetical protein
MVELDFPPKPTLTTLKKNKNKPMARQSLREVFQFVDLALTVYVSKQGRTGHITRWEKSHGAPKAIGSIIMTFFF